MTPLARVAALCAAVLALAGCVGEAVWAPDDVVASSTYVPPGGTATVTLITSINTRNNSGAHSALLIDGTERLLFDPAGSWYNPGIPERNDVLFGMSPPYLDAYLAFQSNGVFVVRTQTFEVPGHVAAQLSQAVLTYGAVAPARCTRSITEVLRSVPDFAGLQQTWFPVNLMNQVSQLPGVREEVIVGTTEEEAEAGAAVAARLALAD